MNMINESRLFQDKLVGIRRDLHRIPEIGFTLPKTRKYIIDRLAAMGIEFTTNEEDSGLIAYINKGKPGKILVFRADMDALPITEETGASYASEHDGMMHACGHDAHIAMLLHNTTHFCDVFIRNICLLIPHTADRAFSAPETSPHPPARIR